MNHTLEQLDRMKAAAKVSKNSELALIIGEKPTTISSWKTRGIPEGQLHRIANILHCSVDWLRKGEGEMRPASPEYATNDPELIGQVIAELAEDYHSGGTMTLTRDEAMAIELLRDLPEEIRNDQLDQIRAEWLEWRRKQKQRG